MSQTLMAYYNFIVSVKVFLFHLREIDTQVAHQCEKEIESSFKVGIQHNEINAIVKKYAKNNSQIENFLRDIKNNTDALNKVFSMESGQEGSGNLQVVQKEEHQSTVPSEHQDEQKQTGKPTIFDPEQAEKFGNTLELLAGVVNDSTGTRENIAGAMLYELHHEFISLNYGGMTQEKLESLQKKYLRIRIEFKNVLEAAILNQ